MRFIDLAGQRFGRWTAVGRERDYRDQGGYARSKWKCICDCGAIGFIDGSNLRNGVTGGCRSCRQLPAGEAAFNDLLSRYKKGAKTRGIAWLLSSDEFRAIATKPCVYCGCAPKAKWPTNDSLNGAFIYSGADRVDNGGPYSEQNCVPCCKACNYMKRDMSKDEFMNHIKSIFEFQKGLKVESLV